ncbi:MAG: DUF3422 domain-containing protein [Alphaproteobacteria bacterium]|nr:DUF3422 domain-containing protein [Alphaproteobacteria bacterium]
MAQFTEHGMRRMLVDEVHARPFESLRAPARASHMAWLTGEGTAEHDRAHLADLCRHFGAAPPAAEANHHSADFGPFRCRWERHSEFTSYTFICDGASEVPFDAPATELIPGDWLAGSPGELLIACHVVFEAKGKGQAGVSRLHKCFAEDSLAGSVMAGGNAEAWTDFRLHEDGFGRILVRDAGLRARQAGRLVQRLLEIETYRIMALLALPLARAAGPEISDTAGELTEITERMTRLEDLEDQRSMLEQLTGLAARMERLASTNTYRFSAAAAYYALTEKRIAELREERIEGLQTIGEFMERRMAPAMRSCEAIAARQDRLAERIGRATALLRTRVDIAMEEQNRNLLRSMDRRARLQLRLQETVEGLSVAAISYYLVGLVGYAAKGAAAAGIAVPVDLVTGLSIPVVILLVWAAVRKVRKRLGNDGAGAAR